jgi:S-adenosyl-L-methionine hydrolase (adenosine-forming)
MPVISLLTDFGTQDEYVGVVKGVILGINPAAILVDITHAVDPQDVAAAAHVIASAVGYFPPGSIHLTIVDPGVGSHRQIVAARMGGHLFVAPNNGILSRVADETRPEEMVHVTNDRWFLHPVSRTFHGRDIFAPVAGHLSMGVDLKSLGPPLNPDDLVRLPPAGPSQDGQGRLKGTVVTVDRFGNLVTDIDMRDLKPLVDKSGNQGLNIEIAGRRILGLSPSYSHVPSGMLLAIAGSRNCLEIAMNRGNAARELKVTRGHPVRVWAQRADSG